VTDFLCIFVSFVWFLASNLHSLSQFTSDHALLYNKISGGGSFLHSWKLMIVDEICCAYGNVDSCFECLEDCHTAEL